MEAKAKRIPWNQYQEYLDLHESQVKPLAQLQELKVLPIELLETQIPDRLKKLHSLLTEILVSNDVIEEKTPNPQPIDPQDFEYNANERKDGIIRNLENNIQLFTDQLQEQNAKMDALKKEHLEEMRSLQEKIMKEHQDQKVRYEQRIQDLNKKLQQTPTKSDQPEEELDDGFFKESLCPHNDQERKYLKSLLGNKQFDLTLLYRGSVHGWTGLDFHKLCDRQGPTVTLFRLKNGSCIGGFTSTSWHTPASSFFGEHSFDSSCLLFNLTEQRSFSIIKSEKAIFCFRAAGPCFGIEELYVEQPFDKENSCKSFANQGGFDIKTKSLNANLLTNQKDGYFTISELEVWKIK